MAARGYEAASISQIAKASGLPASSIYWHFKSKEGVLAAVMERGADSFFSQLGGPGRTPRNFDEAREALREELRSSAVAIRRDPDFLRLFILLLLSRGADETVQRVRRAARERLYDRLLYAYSGFGEEAARRVADELTDVAIAMFDGAFLAVQNDPSLDYEPLLLTMADALAMLAEQLLAEP